MENTRCFDPENMEANEDRTMFEEVSKFHSVLMNKNLIELSSEFTVLFTWFNNSVYMWRHKMNCVKNNWVYQTRPNINFIGILEFNLIYMNSYW